MRKVSRAANFMSPCADDRNAVGIDDLVVGVGEQLEGERVLGAEGLVALDRIEETPRTTAFSASYFGRSRWKLWASMVQPVVMSLG